MKVLVGMLMIALLTACTPKTVDDAYTQGCDSAMTGYAAFTIAAEGGFVPAKTRAAVNAAWDSVQLVCKTRPKNISSAVLVATTAAVTFARAYKEIKK